MPASTAADANTVQYSAVICDVTVLLGMSSRWDGYAARQLERTITTKLNLSCLILGLICDKLTLTALGQLQQ